LRLAQGCRPEDLPQSLLQQIGNLMTGSEGIMVQVGQQRYTLLPRCHAS
jgi:hypothetical protein